MEQAQDLDDDVEELPAEVIVVPLTTAEGVVIGSKHSFSNTFKIVDVTQLPLLLSTLIWVNQAFGTLSPSAELLACIWTGK